MQNLLNQILANIELVTAVVVAIAALIAVIVTEYKKIKAMLAEAKLIKIAVPLIQQAKEDPMGLAHELVTKDELPTNQPIPSYILNNPDEAKKNIVAQALIEREPKKLKKMKLKDLLQVGNFVSDVYQLVKPVIKGK